MNGNEIQRLAHSISHHRPDWMVSSLTTFITRNMSAWTYRDASVALTWVATDAKPDGSPASETPKRVLENGPWRHAIAAGGSHQLGQRPPKRDEACPMCGRFRELCAGSCTRADDDPQPSPDLPPVADINPRLAKRIHSIDERTTR